MFINSYIILPALLSVRYQPYRFHKHKVNLPHQQVATLCGSYASLPHAIHFNLCQFSINDILRIRSILATLARLEEGAA